MTAERPLRGGCLCARNQYIIQRPKDATEIAQVLFDTDSLHRFSHASPLSAFIRIPLAWYRSTTFAQFPDETPALIHRIYSLPGQPHAQRHFCGFCGTPLSYWSEQPRSEADYIRVSLGSLFDEDLRDLEDMGLLSGIVDDESSPLQMEGRVGSPRPIDRASSSSSSSDHLLRPRHVTLPWFETLVAGSRLGGFMLRHSHGILERERAVGSSGVRVEWEIVEWDAAGEDKDMEDGGGADVGVLKRKMDDREADDGAAATT